jgi:thioredoxin-related protein
MLNGNMQFPAFIVIDENSKLLDRFYGYMSPDDFEVLIHFIGDDDYKNEKWDEYKLNFKGSFSEAEEIRKSLINANVLHIQNLTDCFDYQCIV